jgi:hypothetical protein
LLNQGRETYVKPAAFQAATILTDGGGSEELRFVVEVVELFKLISGSDGRRRKVRRDVTW